MPDEKEQADLQKLAEALGAYPEKKEGERLMTQEEWDEVNRALREYMDNLSKGIAPIKGKNC